MTGEVKVTAQSGWLRPWIDEEPTSDCDTTAWECMTYEERQAYVRERAETVVTNYG